MAANRHQFQMADILVFSATLVISTGIGFFNAMRGRKKRTTSEYLLAGRDMPFIPVAISLFVTFKSSILMLGWPAESYVYGLQIFVTLIPHLLANLLCVWIVVPLFYPLKITSIYEYLELRYKSKTVRLLGSLIGMMSELFYMGIVLYGPATALNAVTGFPLPLSIVGMSFIAAIYTSMGGLKAVIWTDVFQTLVMFIGIFLVLIKGTIDAGGARAVWDLAEKGGRMNFLNFDLDPRVRHTFWNLCLSGFVRGFDGAFKQSTILRIGSTANMSDAKKVMLAEGPSSLLICILALYEGIVAFAYYSSKGCDPLKSKQIANPNQIIPLFVMDMFNSPYGLAGWFIASLFSASLSTLSSCQNSISALLWTDMVKPFVGVISERKAMLIAQLSVIASAVLSCGIAGLISLIGGTLQQMSAGLLASFLGPQLGLFFLGCFSPRSNAKGVIIGGVLAFTISMWLSLGKNFTPGLKKTPYLPPASTENCFVENQWYNGTTLWGHHSRNSTLIATTSNPMDSLEDSISNDVFSLNSTQHSEPQGINVIYTMSYTFLPSVGLFGTLIFGYIFSLLTGANKPGDVDPKYLLPVSDTLFIFLPKRLRTVFKGKGTQFMKTEYSCSTKPSKDTLSESDLKLLSIRSTV